MNTETFQNLNFKKESESIGKNCNYFFDLIAKHKAWQNKTSRRRPTYFRYVRFYSKKNLKEGVDSFNQYKNKKREILKKYIDLYGVEKIAKLCAIKKIYGKGNIARKALIALNDTADFTIRANKIIRAIEKTDMEQIIPVKTRSLNPKPKPKPKRKYKKRIKKEAKQEIYKKTCNNCGAEVKKRVRVEDKYFCSECKDRIKKKAEVKPKKTNKELQDEWLKKNKPRNHNWIPIVFSTQEINEILNRKRTFVVNTTKADISKHKNALKEKWQDSLLLEQKYKVGNGFYIQTKKDKENLQTTPFKGKIVSARIESCKIIYKFIKVR